jgi:Lrp/AsnC family transcriptional regulator, leucine-responsive regulatory protein
MDALDREIIRVVQRDARISYRDLGRAVGLSANAAADRLRRLLRSGALRILAVVDPGADAQLRVLIDVQLRPDQPDDAFAAALRDLPAITEGNHVTGTFDYQLRADMPDAASLDRLLHELKRRAGVAATNTRVILRTTLPPALTARQRDPH